MYCKPLHIYSLMAGKTLYLRCISESIRLTGPFSAGPNAAHSPESFHCSTEQQVPLSQGHWFSFLVWHCNNHKFAQEVTVPRPWSLMYCVCVSVHLHVCPSDNRLKESGDTEQNRARDSELQSYCMEHGCIAQGAGYESAETDRPV